MREKSIQRTVIALALGLTFTLVCIAPALADGAQICSGFQLADPTYMKPNDQFSMPGCSFKVTHTSGRHVLKETTSGTMAQPYLGLYLQTTEDVGSGACSGFQLTDRGYFPPNQTYGLEECIFRVKHSSDLAVFKQTKNDNLVPASVGLFLQK